MLTITHFLIARKEYKGWSQLKAIALFKIVWLLAQFLYSLSLYWSG